LAETPRAGRYRSRQGGSPAAARSRRRAVRQMVLPTGGSDCRQLGLDESEAHGANWFTKAEIIHSGPSGAGFAQEL